MCFSDYKIVLSHNYNLFKIRALLSLTMLKYLPLPTYMSLQLTTFKAAVKNITDTNHAYCRFSTNFPVFAPSDTLKSFAITPKKTKTSICSSICDAKEAGSSRIKCSSNSVQTYLKSNTPWLTLKYEHKILNTPAHHTCIDQLTTVPIKLG